MPLHSSPGHAQDVQVVGPLDNGVQLQRLCAFLQHPHYQIAGQLLTVAQVQHQSHRHMVRSLLVHMHHSPVQGGQVAHGCLGERLLTVV